MNPLQSTNEPVQDAAGSTAVNPAPNLINNIPVRAQQGAPPPVKEDDELDKIMRDVGRQLKEEDIKPAKQRFGLFKRDGKRPKTEAKLHAQPLAPKPLTRQDVMPPKPAASPQPLPAVKGAPPPAAAKPTKTSSAPVLAVTLTIIVTAVLIGAAYYAYKK